MSAAAPWIQQILTGNDVARRKARLACIELGAIAVPDLLPLLEDDRAYVRHNAVIALGVIQHPAAAEGLRRRIAVESDIYVRGQAIVALTNCVLADAQADLVALLDQHERGRQFSDKRLSDYAAEGLLKIGTVETWTIVEDWAVQQLTHPNYQDVVAGINQLQRMFSMWGYTRHRILGIEPSEACRSALLNCLEDERKPPERGRRKWRDGLDRVCDRVVIPLWSIFGHEVRPTIETWAIQQLFHPHPEVRKLAIHVLVFAGRERSIPMLLEAMLDRTDSRGWTIGSSAESTLEVIRDLHEVPFSLEQEVIFQRQRSPFFPRY